MKIWWKFIKKSENPNFKIPKRRKFGDWSRKYVYLVSKESIEKCRRSSNFNEFWWKLINKMSRDIDAQSYYWMLLQFSIDIECCSSTPGGALGYCTIDSRISRQVALSRRVEVAVPRCGSPIHAGSNMWIYPEVALTIWLLWPQCQSDQDHLDKGTSGCPRASTCQVWKDLVE